MSRLLGGPITVPSPNHPSSSFYKLNHRQPNEIGGGGFARINPHLAWTKTSPLNQKQLLKQNDIKTSTQLWKDMKPRPVRGINSANFPENRLQLLKHHAAVDQARPNPADAFR